MWKVFEADVNSLGILVLVWTSEGFHCLFFFNGRQKAFILLIRKKYLQSIYIYINNIYIKKTFEKENSSLFSKCIKSFCEIFCTPLIILPIHKILENIFLQKKTVIYFFFEIFSYFFLSIYFTIWRDKLYVIIFHCHLSPWINIFFVAYKVKPKVLIVN
jgi:hypothetical protein